MSEIINSTYEIIGKLGSGGGGIVYLANHLRLNKRVVLKADKRSVTTRETLLRREVDVLKELSQTYIPQVYDYFIEDGVSYTVMDFVDGESLDKILVREGKIPQAKVIKWAKQLLEALAYLHSPTHGDPPRGYVHSDVKPANIILRPTGDICLIDFNISLAMGIDTIIGKSEGYSSPEYYGFEYAVNPLADDKTVISDDTDKTVIQGGSTSSSSSVKKVYVPDARSDIYSVGATLYHLISGRRPDKDAKNVAPLSCNECSPLLSEIIAKAMDPNPQKRFHTADEMLAEINDLRKNDPRVKRFKRQNIFAGAILGVIVIAGGSLILTGLKQTELFQTAKVIAAESADILSAGDAEDAANKALEALVDSPKMFDIPYTAEAQLALTNALGIYDLADEFAAHSVIELPSAPFRVEKSPDGTKIAVCYAYELAVYDLETGKCSAKLPTQESALCELEFSDENRILYAGKDGLTAYDLSADTVLWQAEPATAIALSEDKTTAAAINGKDDVINFYDTETGELISYRELDGGHPDIPENDNFADADRSVFELNGNGSMCAVSLAGGNLQILDLYNPDNDIIIFEDSDCNYFDGAFLDINFAFSVAGNSGALFGIVDWKNPAYLGDMPGSTRFRVRTYGGELYITQSDTIVKMDMEDFSQTPAAYTENKDITVFDISDKYIISAYDGGYSIFSRGARILQTAERETAPDHVLITDEYAVIGDRDSSNLEILKFKDCGGALLMVYDPEISHSEARIFSDGSGAMLFSINGFTLLDKDGNAVNTVKLPDPDKIYDQQFRRCDDEDYLEVTYYSGKVTCYSAKTGEKISENIIDPPDDSLYEEFETAEYLICDPLHGAPEVYKKETGEKFTELHSEEYLTYITETGDYIVAQYVSANGEKYGELMNKNCEVIARLPNLCDVWDGKLVFDFPAGNLKISQIYELDELKQFADNHRN